MKKTNETNVTRNQNLEFAERERERERKRSKRCVLYL